MNRLARGCAFVIVSSFCALAAAEDNLPPQIVHEPCEFYQKGKPFTIIARIYDDSPLFDPKVVYRSSRVKDWRSASFSKAAGTDDFKATIRSRDLRGSLEYFIETFDENGNGPARYGSPDAPVRVLPSEEAEECIQTGQDFGPIKSVDSSKLGGPTRGKDGDGTTETIETGGRWVGDPLTQEIPPSAKTGCNADNAPIYCSPVLWTVLGVAVAAGIIVPVVVVTTSGSGPAEPPAYVDLTVSGPDVTGALP